ncbi:MAG TPA: reverse transcriptase-like protein [Gaiellaceae bacterium]|nr:reverse transcriptase-like protein [Gaiellaceae bacterium]
MPACGRRGGARALDRDRRDAEHRRLGRARARSRDRALKARLYTDGGARGNPGPAASAFVLETDDGTVVASAAEAIGIATNNVAEYRALIAGLRSAAEAGVTELEVVSDSELMVKQMRGEYRIKNSVLRELAEEAQRAGRSIGRVRYTAVRRERNELADRLVNEALDAAGH